MINDGVQGECRLIQYGVWLGSRTIQDGVQSGFRLIQYEVWLGSRRGAGWMLNDIGWGTG